MFFRSCVSSSVGSWKTVYELARFHHHSQTAFILQRGGLDKFCGLSSRCYSKFSSDKKNELTDSSRSKNQVNARDEKDTHEIVDVEKVQSKFSGSVPSPKYTVFKDEDAPLILDVEEERLLVQTSRATVQPNEFEGISFERGIHGVFDVEELVNILKKQRAKDIFVVEIPAELAYANQMVIVSGKSSRHILAMATYVRRLFKKKMMSTDKIPIIEGKKNKSDDWLALDLGNIVLHLFMKDVRTQYDLESLWALGSEFDPHLKKVEQDPLSTIIKKHSVLLDDLHPA